MGIDLVLAVCIVGITWMAGGSIQSLLAQIPTLGLNAYLLVVIRSFFLQLAKERREAAEAAGGGSSSAGGSSSGGGGALDGEDDEVEISVSGVAKRAGAAGHSDSEEEDADIGRGERKV